MLTPFDDYPLHQTSQPVARHGAEQPQSLRPLLLQRLLARRLLYFAAALGLYPNRKVMDAAFAVLRDGEEISVIASRRAPLDPTETRVGPISITVEEPFRRLRVRVEPNESGLTADLVFGARSPVVEEPRFTLFDDATAVFDYTRLTQLGAWDGTLGDRRRRDTRSARPRSSGGATAPGAFGRSASAAPPGPGGSGRSSSGCGRRSTSTTCASTSTSTSSPTAGAGTPKGLIMPVLSAPTDPAFGPDVKMETDGVGARRRALEARHAPLRRRDDPFRSAPRRRAPVELEPLATFQMRGLGYLHPEFGHGHWNGDLAVHADRWKVDDGPGVDPFFMHVQQIVRARTMGDGSASACSSSSCSGPTNLRDSPNCSTAPADETHSTG